jgi:predicted nucleic acid-binding protein
MEQYLIDNNIISGYFSDLLPKKGINFVANVLDKTPNISVITQIEILSWVQSDKQKENILKDFISDSKVYLLNSEIVDECIKIRRSKKIKTPDAIIAATAIITGSILLTNDKDFIGIQNLKVINPFLL